jgi:hypothetical protein
MAHLLVPQLFHAAFLYNAMAVSSACRRLSDVTASGSVATSLCVVLVEVRVLFQTVMDAT